MTMMASFLSNINIPAGSLFFPRGKAIVPFWKLSVKAWNVPLIFFPLLVYLLVSRWRANLSHQAQTALFPRSRGQNNWRAGWVGGCVSLPQSASPETDIQSAEAETEVLTSASVRKAQSLSANVRNWSPKHWFIFFIFLYEMKPTWFTAQHGETNHICPDQVLWLFVADKGNSSAKSYLSLPLGAAKVQIKFYKLFILQCRRPSS